jgi:glycosyltransferase involved in cell wall biosynthesis
MPKVTVSIPTFNRVNLLPFAIESVLKQSYQDFELIVCDDGSADGTPELMSQYTDSRIKYIRHPQILVKAIICALALKQQVANILLNLMMMIG